MSQRLLVMAGGTGGHVFPGLAVAHYLRDLGWQVHWLGTSARMEATTVPKYGYPISFIDVAGVRGNGLARLLKAPFQILRAVFQARRVLKDFRPDVVLGMGGFASGPGGVAAWSMGIPLVLHEQNAVPGMTNKWLSRVAQRVLSGFDKTFAAQQQDAEKYRWVGNPVRAEFFELPVKQAVDTPLNLLVVGGSLGARALNEAVPQALADSQQFCVRHQCGAGHLETVLAAYREQVGERLQWQVEEFIDDMASAFAWADLVICRAGALTVAEVAAAARCAIFVPLPHAVDDHQTKNAQALVSQQAAYLLPEHQMNKETLENMLDKAQRSPQTLVEMGQRARTLAKLDATASVAEVCQQQARAAA